MWIDEGDILQIQRVTGLTAYRCDMPAPTMPARGSSLLMPQDVSTERQSQMRRSKTRFMALATGTVIAAAIAIVATLTSLALQERNLLREKVANLTPRSSRVMDHKKAWHEVAPAVDPTIWPQQILLHFMEPESSKEVSITHLEWTPERMNMRGRMPSATLAFEYTQALKSIDALAPFG